MPLHLPPTGVAIPLRAFGDGKARLADRLDPVERERLLRAMADRVAAAAAGLPLAVISDDAAVVAWAEEMGAEVLADHGTLDAAAHFAQVWAQGRSFDRLVIAHADLPLARTLEPVLRFDADAIAAVRSHRDNGTPVLTVPSRLPFEFAYGVDSFDRHRAEALRHGVAFHDVDDPDLAFDLDRPEDFDAIGARLP